MRLTTTPIFESGPMSRAAHGDILHFTLQGLLKDGYVLTLHPTHGTAALLCCDEQGPRMLMQEYFTSIELTALMPLLDSYPYYCPYEVLHASVMTGHVSEKSIAQARERLQHAVESGLWDAEFRPVRNALSRTRLKTRAFGIEIPCIEETGYILLVSDRYWFRPDRKERG